MPRLPDLPATKFLRFLSSYGSSDNNTNLFDEKVHLNARKNNVVPFVLKTDFVDRMVDILKSPKPVSVLIAGVAGDGKSFHLRHTWVGLGGCETAWNENRNLTLDVTMTNGETRSILFIKDLSANQTNFDLIWEKLVASRTDPKVSVVIACNHGQILNRLSARPDAADVLEGVEDTFFQADTERYIDNLVIFDLSRTSQSDRLEEIIRLICRHEKWLACSTTPCAHKDFCPIRRHLDLLWNAETDQPTPMTRRLCQLVRVAGFDGFHVPIRELFLLAVNAILGCKSSGMASCHTVQTNLTNPEKAKTIDIFQNLLGNNMATVLFRKKSMYGHLAQFEVGEHGDPYFDQIILIGDQHPDPEIRSLFAKYFHNFPEQPSDGPKDCEERLAWLIAARRRLFFLWDEPHHREEIWRLTAYRHVPQYLQMREDAQDDDQIDQTVIDGLNRVLTGSSQLEGQDIQIATNGADSRTPVGLLLVGKINADMQSGGNAWVSCDAKGADAVPVLYFLFPQFQEEPLTFSLLPRRYEFLASLAEGYLPTSFSGQCQSEFYSLKAVLVRASARVKNPKKTQTLSLRFIDKTSVTLKTQSSTSGY